MSDDDHGKILHGEADSLRRAYQAFHEQAIDFEDLAEGPREDRVTTLASSCSVSGPGTFSRGAEQTLTFFPSERPGWWIDRNDLPDALPMRVAIDNVWTTGNIVSNIDETFWQRRRALVGALLAFWVVIVGAEWALPGIEPPTVHAPHTLTASAPGTPGAAEFDHPHASTGGSAYDLDASVEAIAPRGAFTPTVLVLAAVVTVVPVIRRDGGVGLIRGPPRISALHLSGRDVLVRLCIARR